MFVLWRVEREFGWRPFWIDSERWWIRPVHLCSVCRPPKLQSQQLFHHRGLLQVTSHRLQFIYWIFLHTMKVHFWYSSSLVGLLMAFSKVPSRVLISGQPCSCLTCYRLSYTAPLAELRRTLSLSYAAPLAELYAAPWTKLYAALTATINAIPYKGRLEF